jgi:uncharacterized membrane protein
MKMLSHALKALGVIPLAVVIFGGNSQAGEPATLLSPRNPPLFSNSGVSNIAAGRELRSLQSTNGQGRSRGRALHFGRLDLTHGKNNPDAAGGATLAHWSDSFTYNGLVYNYTMVGTDPKKGSATTVIPTVLIPIRFVFADGNVFDATTDIVNGQTPIQGIINSPIFQNYNFNNKGVRVGNTQWGDAFQRANFWNSVSTNAPNYHVLLGQPTVLPAQTINVPNGSFSYFFDPVTGLQPVVDDNLLGNIVGPLLFAANLPANVLPIMVWGQVSGFFTGGFHGAITFNGTPVSSFVATTYSAGGSYDFPDLNLSGIFFEDTYPLSHEIAEWMDDPFINNFTPGWDTAFLFPGQTAPDLRCDSGFSGFLDVRDLLEVGDPVESWVQSDVPLPGPSYTYHVTEAVFIDWFTRATRSRSYNGRYAMFEVGLTIPGFARVTPPTPVCTGHVEFTPTYVDFPGATFTAVEGLNNSGTAVGYYFDAAGSEHGFIVSGSKYTNLDYPGSLATAANKINDAGAIVGSFLDSSFATHGFSYKNGKWTQIDFPGSADTEANGINAAGDIVGVYDSPQPVTHAFMLRNGQYQRLDTPFGTQSVALAINDPGSITGVGYTDPANGPFTGFVKSHDNFSSFQFPDSLLTQLSSINNSNDLAGSFFDPDGNFWGMVTVSGIPYQVDAGVFGNDNFDRICGYALDFNTGRYRGFIGTLPLERNAH